jgi:RNA polymerase sigma-B factor
MVRAWSFVSESEAAELLAARAAAGDDLAAERLVATMQPLLSGMARRFQGRVPRSDLEQAGVVGLLRAARSFDRAQGTPFGGYAAPFVMGEMLACVRQLAGPLRVPRDVAANARAVATAIDELAAERQRSPTIAEIAQRAGIGEDDVLDALRAERATHAVPLGEVEFAEVGIPDDALRRVEQRLALGSRLERLDRRSRTVLLLRFGLELSQREIAARLGISQMHVSRLLRSAIEKLDQPGEEASSE